MLSAEHFEVGDIARHAHEYFDHFQIAVVSLNEAVPEIKIKLPQEVLNDELGRFRIWASNIGAHGKGRTSLDYRLREASHLRDRVIELLKTLGEVLTEASNICKGEKVSWEDVTVSDSDSDSGTDEDDPETELTQLMSNVGEITTCLMRLSMSIRNPAPHDQFRESKHISSSHYEEYDVRHVQEKFPSVQAYLALRFGKGISRRRQYLTYREEYRRRLGQGLVLRSGAPAHNDLVAGNAPSQAIQSTVASSIPLAAKNVNTAADLDTTELFDDAFSQTSFASSEYDETKLRPPPRI